MNIKGILLTFLVLTMCTQPEVNAAKINIGVRLIRGGEVTLDKKETIDIDVTSNIEQTLLNKLFSELHAQQTTKKKSVEVHNSYYRLVVIDQMERTWFLTYEFPASKLSFKRRARLFCHKAQY